MSIKKYIASNQTTAITQNLFSNTNPTNYFGSASIDLLNRLPINFQQQIQGCLRGDRSSQNELYHHFAPPMFTLCLRYSRDREQAAELLQEGFIKVFGALHQYKEEGSFEGWIRKIMVNTALQYFRSRTPLHAVVSIDSGIEGQSSEEEGIESKLSAKELLAMVQTLPATYRLVFNLYVFEGYKHKEIATLLNVSEGTSKSNLYDARQILKEKVLAMAVINNRKSQCL